jgi:type IV secretion system protein VirD4
MVSRQETARPLLTPGEVMQLPPDDELILVSSFAPIRAKKLRYYEDRNFTSRIADAPALGEGRYVDVPAPRPNDWGGQVRGLHEELAALVDSETSAADDDGGMQLQRHPALAELENASQPDADTRRDADMDDESDSQSTTITRGKLGIVGRAHAINEGEHRRGADDDLMPAF